ncbi:hypothetical protein WN944_003175 [Citrus x changshan-huyou]|uniref:Prolamin-like domain-containing protein n=1 Tax=Citrus x changshan-huyou TaxID=2935761 RepID=A0AAP0LY00_9ROSI
MAVSIEIHQSIKITLLLLLCGLVIIFSSSSVLAAEEIVALPPLRAKLHDLLEQCAQFLTAQCGATFNAIMHNRKEDVEPSDECCMRLIVAGPTCHRRFVEVTLPSLFQVMNQSDAMLCYDLLKRLCLEKIKNNTGSTLNYLTVIFQWKVVPRKDQEQYWFNTELSHSYFSVDLFYKIFKESTIGNFFLQREIFSLRIQNNSAVLKIMTMTVFLRRGMETDVFDANYYTGSLFYELVILLVDGVSELPMTAERL